MVGDFTGPDGLVHGYTLKNGHFTQIDHPGPYETSIRGIDLLGRITGLYAADDGSSFGLIVGPRGAMTSFEVPGSAPGSTGAFAINALGIVVGTWADADGAGHGFARIPSHQRDDD